MKTMVIIIAFVVAALVVLGTILSALPAFAQDNDNFKAAGQQMLQAREEVLMAQKTAIETFVLKMPEDKIITKDEMLVLWQMVGDFNQIKKAADKYLQFYGIQTATELKKEHVEITQKYFGEHGLVKRNGNGSIRKFFTSQTGTDIVVKKAVVVFHGSHNGLLGSIAALVSMGLTLALVAKNWVALPFFFVGGLVLLFFLFG